MKIPEYLYHVTRKSSLDRVLKSGLKAKVPRDMKNEPKGVYLFKTVEDLEDAVMNWLGDRFDEDDELVMIKIDGRFIKNNDIATTSAGFEIISKKNIPPEAILLVEEI